MLLVHDRFYGLPPLPPVASITLDMLPSRRYIRTADVPVVSLDTDKVSCHNGVRREKLGCCRQDRSSRVRTRRPFTETGSRDDRLCSSGLGATKLSLQTFLVHKIDLT